MKISKKYLQEFLPKLEIDHLSRTLFDLGHEHSIDNADIIDLEITPNRGDCLSVLGIARDLYASSLINKSNECPIKYFDNNKVLKFESKKPLVSEIESLELDFVNNAPDDCPEIFFLMIEIEKLPTSYEKYLENYFADLDLKKNNFFTDISNFLSYEIGQPTHCYDANKIDGQLTLEKSKQLSNFKTLSGYKVDLQESDLVFKSNNSVVNIAGVMGGLDTACTNQTKKVLIECAYFHPEAIIGKARKYNLNSDAAYKFERGINPDFLETALSRFIKIVEDHTNILNSSIFHYSNEKFKKNNKTILAFDINKIEKILGIQNDSEISFEEILINLGFVIKDNQIIAPSYRNDIFNINDIAEEIARVIGFNCMIFASQKNKLSLKRIQTKPTYEQKIRLFLKRNGFNEVINFPFSNEEDSGSLEVLNPLDKKFSFLRKGLEKSLLENLSYNERRQKNSIKLFEISDTYSSNKDKINCEKKLSLIVCGHRGNNYRDFSKKLDISYLFELSKDLLGLSYSDLQEFIKEHQRKDKNSSNKEKIYSLEVPLNLVESKKIDKLYNNFLTDINELEFRNSFLLNYKKPSEFPSTYRDLSFSIKKIESVKLLYESVNSLDSIKYEIMKEVFLFDLFENKKNNETKMAFRFIFQSHDHTLKDQEVDKIIDDIVESLTGIEGVEVPGYFVK